MSSFKSRTSLRKETKVRVNSYFLPGQKFEKLCFKTFLLSKCTVQTPKPKPRCQIGPKSNLKFRVQNKRFGSPGDL
jgi:hypothetical protein